MPPRVPPLPPTMNPWEVNAFNNAFVDRGASRTPDNPSANVHDALIYPGLYSGTGFDLMSVLLQVMSRPHPVIELGPIDCSVALVVYDLQHPNRPIVYCSDAFCDLTGYARNEVLGKDCHFLQTFHSTSHRSRPAIMPDKAAVQSLSQAIHDHQEIQLQILNFKKDGTPFNNIISIVPVDPLPTGYRYAVGFQVEQE